MNALVEYANEVEKRMRAQEVLTDTVGDLASKPDCPPQLRAAWIRYLEAKR